MSQPERRWMPGPGDLPWTTHLINPQGDRHLGFCDNDGRFYRLWQFRKPEALRVDEAILLRPSEIDLIIKIAMIWVAGHPGDPRCTTLVDEAAAGAKTVVLHFAGLAHGIR